MAGYVFRPTFTRDGVKRRVEVWWIGYSRNGRRFRESSKSTNKADAEALLARRLAESRAGGPLPSDLRRVTFADLMKLRRLDHKRKGNRSALPLKHLEAHFEGWQAADIGRAAIIAYADKRSAEGAAGATINRELSSLRRAMRLAYRRGMLAHVPPFDMLPEGRPREGFIDEDQFQRLRAALPDYLRPLVEFLYVTAWRKGEALALTWDMVDLKHGWVRIEGSQTKSGRARQFPLIPRLRALLEAQRAKRDSLAEKTGQEIDAVFFYYRTRGRVRAGDPIRNFRSAWSTAVRKAGLPNLRPHDLRRSGIRHFIRSGVNQRLALDLSGHETPSVMERYNITAEADLAEAGAKLSAFFEDKTATSTEAK